MAETVIDIASIFETLYGRLPYIINTPAHVGTLPPQPNAVNPFNIPQAAAKKTQTATGSPLYGLSDMIGREVFMPITLTSNGIDYNFPFGIMGLKNRIIEKSTPMTERGGEVIEEIAVGAWEFDFKGFLIDANDQFPDDQLTQLKNLYTNRVPVELKCALTDIFLPAPNQVVILSLDIPPKAKVIGVREFAMVLKQDSILDLYKVE